MIKSSLDRSNQQITSRNSIFGDQKHSGSTVPLIFMFCDIRGFTDSSECLNNEVFVFTNRIAEVVHSYCHAYGGSANKVRFTDEFFRFAVECIHVHDTYFSSYS